MEKLNLKKDSIIRKKFLLTCPTCKRKVALAPYDLTWEGGTKFSWVCTEYELHKEKGASCLNSVGYLTMMRKRINLGPKYDLMTNATINAVLNTTY